MIIGLVIVELIIIIGSTMLYNRDFAKKADIREFYQSANRIETKSDFDYLLETGSGRSIIQTELSAVDGVTMNQISTKRKFIVIKAKYQKYLPHTETYTTTNSKGETKTHTRIVWEWETVGRDVKTANQVKFFGSVYDTSLFAFEKYEQEIPVKEIIKGSNDSDNVQSTGNGSRTIWTGVSEKVRTTFYADLTDSGLKPIAFPNEPRDKQIRLHKNQPIAVFLKDELKANTPHPVAWTIITMLFMIAAGTGGVLLIQYE